MANGDEFSIPVQSPDIPRVTFDQGAADTLNSLDQQQLEQFQSGLDPDVRDAFNQAVGQDGVVAPTPPNLQIEPETFTSPPEFDTPRELFTGGAAPARTQFQEDLLGDTDVSTIPVPITAEEISSIGDRTTESIINSSRLAASESGTLKQQKKLSERHSVTDHYDYSVDVKGSGADVTIQTTGAMSNGKVVGRTEPRSITVSGKHAAQIGEKATRFAARYDSMSPMQQAIGSMQLLADTVRPYIKVERDAKGGVTRGVPEAAAVANIVDSLSIYNQWSNLSEVGRFRATANQVVNLADELGFADSIPANATDGLALLNFGYSTYNLLDNWDKMDAGQRTIGVLHAVNQGVQAYQGGVAVLNSLTGTAAAGTAAAASTTAAAGTAAAGTTAAAAGTTAAAGTAAAGAGTGAATASGVGSTGAAAAGSGATGATAASTAIQAAGYVAVVYAAYNIVDGWGTGGAAGRASMAANGAAIGTAIFPGIGTAIGAAVGLAIGSIKTGKAPEQGKRDALRDFYEKNELFGKDERGSHYITLADGSRYDVGVDGSEGRAKNADGSIKTVANPDKIAERDKGAFLEGGELRPYDIDYTNDLDYVTSLATRGVNLLPAGGSVSRRMGEVDQMNGYMTNAATFGIGREFTEENFNKAMANARTFYEKLGITSAADGYRVIDEMRKNKQLSRDDYNAIRLGLNFAFDQNFAGAQQLMSDLARDKPPANVGSDEFRELQREDLAELED